jgi:SAM-dependent methyltransferase
VEFVKSVLKGLIPPGIYRGMVKRRYRLNPSPLDPWRRLSPVAPDNNSRGLSVDRYYIEAFLSENSSLISGTVLEIAEDTYTKRFGRGVTRSDILTDPRSGATRGLRGDLRVPGTLQAELYDCIILTQTLQFIDKPLLAIDNLYDALKGGGTLLITIPGIAQRDNYDDNLWGDFYRWMPRGFEFLLSESKFKNVRVVGLGNILATVAFLYNMAIEDMRSDELSHVDRDYPLVVTCVAQKK